MNYILKLETAKTRILERMRHGTDNTRRTFKINPAAYLKGIIDAYYGLTKRIKPEDRAELKSWFDQRYEEYGERIYAIMLEQLIEDFKHHLLYSRK